MGIFLTACGGGGSDIQASGGSGSDQLASTGCGHFCPSLLSAPPDGATVSGFVRLDVSATNMKNAELLPETGDMPKYGKLNLIPYNDLWSGAYMDLDTTRLPNGPFKVRLVIFDATAGQPARQEVVFTRTWNINNGVATGSLAVTSVNAPGNGTVVSGTRRLEIRGTGLSNVELLPASGYTPKLGVFNVTADKTYAWLDLDTRTQADGLKNVRISAFNVTEGQPGAQEVVAMPARQWNFQNGLGSFNGNTIMAPVHGSVIGHFLHVIVRGNNLENVELLPASGYTPKLGSAYISPDKKEASVLIDVRTLPQGVNDFRVSAFNKPAGDPTANEIVVMPPRKLDLR